MWHSGFFGSEEVYVRRILLVVCAVVFALEVEAQSLTSKTRATGEVAGASMSAMPAADSTGGIKDLPVRKVVLYKNGVGYFEHAGTVSGNERVAVDFTSMQRIISFLRRGMCRLSSDLAIGMRGTQ
jgi:hypothetical protein